MTVESPIVEEVRRRRMAISERYGHDLRRYCAHLLELQGQIGEGLIQRVPPRKECGGDERQERSS